MPIQFSHRGTWMCAVGCLLLSGSGCHSLAPWSISRPEQKTESGESSPATDPRVQNALANAAWVAVARAADNTPSPMRWRHPLLEALPPGEHLDDFRQACTSKQPIVAANAVVALARYADEASAEDLAAIVRQRQHPLPLRVAAAESLGRIKEPEAAEQLRTLLEPMAGPEGAALGGYVPDLHAELLYALARHVRPADEPAFLSSLNSASVPVRLAAAKAWVEAADARLPAELLDRRTDSDVRVRAMVLEAIGKSASPPAREHLNAALNDYELPVRMAAIRGLGMLTDDASRQDLQRLAKHDAELIRAAAVAALAKRGDAAAVLAAAGDASWHVRQAVASHLTHHHDPACVAAAGKLLSDPSPQVQQQMAATLGQWPLERAAPLLMAAMNQSAFAIRQTARDELARRWPDAREFIVDAPAESRAARLAELRDRWEKKAGPAKPGPIDLAQALGPLIAGTPASDSTEPLLRDLQATDINRRRQAAEDLAAHAAKTPLTAEAVETLCSRVVSESDPLVWRSTLTALSHDAGEAAARLACAGLSHPAAEVRRRACEHLAQHPKPEHAQALLKSLEDEPQVARAAVQALLKSKADLDPACLERLLSSPDKSLRVEAAEGLVRLSAPAGVAALERLAFDADPATRRLAAAAMGRTADETFVPSLMRMLDDQGGVREAALSSLAQIAGRDVARDPNMEPPRNSLEEVRRWQQWHQSRQ